MYDYVTGDTGDPELMVSNPEHMLETGDTGNPGFTIGYSELHALETEFSSDTSPWKIIRAHT